MPARTLELDEVIRRCAWAVLKRRVNFIRRWFLDEKDYICEVDWSALSLEHKVAKFEPKERDNTTIETNWGKVVTGSRWVPLWSCDFDNKAKAKQSHNFRGSRNTTTWLDVDLGQYYTIKNEVDIAVNIPPNLSKFRAGRDNTCHLNKVKGQVFKEILTWEVNSQVEVMPNWRAHAELLAREECHSMEFEIRTTLYNPTGFLPVYFKRKSDGKVAYLVELENFANAFTLDEAEGGLSDDEKLCVEVKIQRTVDANGEQSSSCHPQIITKGTCVGVTWSDQKVDIRTIPLTPSNVAHLNGPEEEDVLDGHLINITRASSTRSAPRWRGSEASSVQSSMDAAEADLGEIILTSNNANGTIVSSMRDRQFIIRHKEGSHA